ncbi:hypothetical protein [Huintestinicola sp.]|uniref:hypothetical protein n=1 Tax=Huintestinicola sp. TaxID=2981661 RepID=UPI003D7E5C50
MSFIVNSGLIRLMPSDSMAWGLNSSDLTDKEKEQYEVIASLNEKLRKEHINITEELKELEDEDMELYDVT